VSDGEEASGAATFQVAAAAYDRHVGRYAPQLARALITAAGVRPPQRALDVGCGPGALTGELAAVLGAGSVVAVDPSDSFVQACRARHPGVDVRSGAAEDLPVDDDAVDVVVSQMVVNFCTDADAALAEMRRAARGGGTVAGCVWDYAEGMELLRAFWDAAREVDPEAGAAQDEAVVMAYCREGELAALWTCAGLQDVVGGQLVVAAAYDDFDDLWDPLTTGVGPSGAFASGLDADGRDALRAALHRRLGAPERPFELSARAWFAKGTVADR
jgi:ubiquinone/menaquinone biosynthesis C-methylase UbiE